MRNAEQHVIPFHFSTDDPDLDRLLKPATIYRSPADVVDDTQLSLPEKRAILSSWASDACAVESKPAWRQPPGFTEPVTFDGIMAALQDLDRKQTKEQAATPARSFQRTPVPTC